MKTPDSLKKAKSSAVSVAQFIKALLMFLAALPPEVVLLVVVAFVCGVML